ncbi:MAG: GNAT family N-acetyltransferase [Gemmatimonadaceae bacterium]
MSRPSTPLVTDLTLARRLERAEGSANAAFVEAHAARTPSLGAAWVDVSGTYAMFDGVESPITQTFGLGLFSPPADDDLDALEHFFHSRGAKVHHEVCPLADVALLTHLSRRGYQAIELSTVMVQQLETPPSVSTHPTTIVAREVAADEIEAWVDASARGWSDTPEAAEFMREFGPVSASSRGVTCFVAELDGAIVGTGALATHEGVALLAGASTIPQWRGRGAQTALLLSRLAVAAEQGCDLAMMAAAPGSTSQLNAERQGFRIAYTRTKWQRA